MPSPQRLALDTARFSDALSHDASPALSPVALSPSPDDRPLVDGPKTVLDLEEREDVFWMRGKHDPLKLILMALAIAFIGFLVFLGLFVAGKQQPDYCNTGKLNSAVAGKLQAGQSGGALVTSFLTVPSISIVTLAQNRSTVELYVTQFGVYTAVTTVTETSSQMATITQDRTQIQEATQTTTLIETVSATATLHWTQNVTQTAVQAISQWIAAYQTVSQIGMITQFSTATQTQYVTQTQFETINQVCSPLTESITSLTTIPVTVAVTETYPVTSIETATVQATCSPVSVDISTTTTSTVTQNVDTTTTAIYAVTNTATVGVTPASSTVFSTQSVSSTKLVSVTQSRTVTATSTSTSTSYIYVYL